MPHLDTILDILKRHHPRPQLPARRPRRHPLPRRKQVFQNVHHPHPQRGAEPLEDQVRVAFRHGAARGARDVLAQHHVGQGEGGRGPVRQVRDGERGGRAAVFVQQQDVRQSGGGGGADERGQHERAPVQPDGGREQEPDFFAEGREPRGGRAGGGD